MELSSVDGFVETQAVARPQRSRRSENSLDSLTNADHRTAQMASHRFSLDPIHYRNLNNPRPIFRQTPRFEGSAPLTPLPMIMQEQNQLSDCIRCNAPGAVAAELDTGSIKLDGFCYLSVIQVRSQWAAWAGVWGGLQNHPVTKMGQHLGGRIGTAPGEEDGFCDVLKLGSKRELECSLQLAICKHRRRCRFHMRLSG
jgi:hypothetical protein